MRAEVDQSGKIEWTQKPTVRALANNLQFSIFVSAHSKREILEKLEELRPTNNRTNHHLLVFATLLFLLLKDHLPKMDEVIVDVEYQGHEARIKEHFFNLCLRHKIRVEPSAIVFHRVGKKSPAHNLAIRVFRGEVKPGRIVQSSEILREIKPKRRQ